MLWRKKKPPVQVPSDIEDARGLKSQQTGEIRQVAARQSYIDGLTQALIERRERNHFGDQIQISFTREHHA